jgi:GTP-binding protein
MKKLTRVAIIGFPNVGKSTLFNRFLREKKSLVHSLPGMTRDQVSALCRLDEKSFILTDTGGFLDSSEDPFSSQVKAKAWAASREADIILFVMDGKRGLLPAEEELYISLKKLNKPIFLVINKIDSPMEEDNLGDYFRLGQEKLFPISAEHKRNLGLLMECVTESLPPPPGLREDEKPLKIALVGRINVGKSSLVNRLIGEERLIVSEIPGTTRDSTDTMIRRNKKDYCLVDTAGIRKLSRTRDKREKASIIKAKKDIRRTDVVCLILDAGEFPTRQDTAIAHIAQESGKPLLIVLNKWDMVLREEKSPQTFKSKVYEKLDFVAYAPLLFISALTGQRVVKILDTAGEVYAGGSRKIKTSQLNEFLGWVNANHPPVSRRKKRIKIKYIVQKRVLPPTFFLFTHSPVSLAPSYEKFFIGLLRKRFDIWGTPIRLILKQS